MVEVRRQPVRVVSFHRMGSRDGIQVVRPEWQVPVFSEISSDTDGVKMHIQTLISTQDRVWLTLWRLCLLGYPVLTEDPGRPGCVEGELLLVVKWEMEPSSRGCHGLGVWDFCCGWHAGVV